MELITMTKKYKFFSPSEKEIAFFYDMVDNHMPYMQEVLCQEECDDDDARVFNCWLDEEDVYIGERVCHSHLECSLNYPLSVNFYCEGVEHWNYSTNEEKIFLIDWSLNRSPWASCYLDHNAEVAFDRGYELILTKNPRYLVGCAHMYIRSMWEHGWIARNFKPMVEAGIPESAAFILAYLDYGQFSQGHSLFYPLDWTDKALWDFCEGNYYESKIDNTPTYLNGNSMYCSDIFCTNDGCPLTEILYTAKEKLEFEESEAINYNPFISVEEFKNLKYKLVNDVKLAKGIWDIVVSNMSEEKEVA
jgi:hypothetical protein